jgi:hypothetical protein
MKLRYCNNCYNNFTPLPGPPGEAATIAIGSTTTGLPGTNASVTNSGTNNNAILNFVIPSGETPSLNSGNFISRSSQTYSTSNSIIQLPTTINSQGITNSNGIITLTKEGRYLINYGIQTETANNTIGIYINGINNNNTNITTTENNLSKNASIILNLNTNDTITLGAVDASITQLTLQENTINAYLTIISID